MQSGTCRRVVISKRMPQVKLKLWLIHKLKLNNYAFTFTKTFQLKALKGTTTNLCNDNT